MSNVECGLSSVEDVSRGRAIAASTIHIPQSTIGREMSAPPIYVANHQSPPMAWSTRAMAALVAIGCLVVLIIAARLAPDPSGMGTHRQLGLAPCGLLKTFGVPCPTCGMTTSFANVAHGHVVASLRGQPAGTVLAMLTACGVWIGGYVAATGRPGAAIARRLPTTRALVALLAIVIAGWAYTIAVVVFAHRTTG